MSGSRDSGEARVAWAALSRICEPGDTDLAALVREHGPVATWEAARAGDLPPGRGLRALAVRVQACRPEDDLAAAERCGARLVCPGDAEWPARLEQLATLEEGPPVALWVRGPLPLDEAVRRSVAVVGARAATDYGTYVAGELGAGLADRGWSVVSGGAYGIDAAAHRGALAGAGTSVAVLGCGVDVAYPRGHDALFARLAEQGLLVSELPPGSTPQRRRFLVRNRLIAALTAGTVVVEAALRSGALSTARRAAELLRHVMAVPGPVTSAMSAGTHQLLREAAAVLVSGPAEVAEQVGALGGDLAPEPRAPAGARDALDATARRVLDGLPARGAVSTARVAVEAGVDALTARAGLRALERAGWVTREGELYRLVRDAPSDLLDLPG